MRILIVCLFLLFACKRDEKVDGGVHAAPPAADAGPVSDARLFALPPRGNQQISCLRDHAETKGAPIKFYCWNTEGQWACDFYGCAWLKALPAGHPFTKSPELELPAVPVPGVLDGGIAP